MHTLGIERFVDPPRAVAVQGRTLQAIEDEIAITARGCRKARMEFVVNSLCPGDRNIGWQIGVGAQQPAPITALALGIEMHHLAGGVYTRVGTPRADDLHILVRHNRERLFDALLNSEPGLLALPAVVRRAVVFDAERCAHERTVLAGV